MSTITPTILAMQFVDSHGRIVESGSLLANEVVRQLQLADVVRVDFQKMRGLSSSYFNVFLQRVLPVTTMPDFPRRVEMLFDSPAQEQVFRRSLDSVQRTVA